MNTLSFNLKNGKKCRIGYRTPGFSLTHSPEDKMKLANDLGMEIVEPMINEREISSLDHANALKQAADEYGVDIPSCGVMLPFADPGASKTIDSDLEFCLQCCDIFEIDYLFSTVAFPPANIAQDETWNLIVPRIQHAASILQQHQVRLAIEPEWFIDSLERMSKLISLVNHENCYINYDPVNFYLSGSDPIDIFDSKLIHLVSKGHIKDAVFQTGRKEEVPIGDGELDYKTIFSKIIAQDHPMDLFIEHCSDVDSLSYSVKNLKKILPVAD